MPSKTVTQVPASSDHITCITINIAKTGIECFVTYKSFDSGGTQIGHHKVLPLTLTQEEKDTLTLTALLGKHVVNAVNATEGT